MSSEPDLNEIRQAMRAFADECKDLVEHPEVLDSFTPLQLAWTKEHLEFLLDELYKTQERVKRLLKEAD